MINIKVHIAEREYPLSVAPETEPQVKKAAELINEKVKFHRNNHKVELADALSMSSLEIGTEYLALQQSNQSRINELEQQVDDICSMLR
ncbi:MAG TPA: cell division protein ZapA [Bacteroidia bacterium]|nr:cell division protein ZapA [Bacteroidia bacterium]